MRQLSVNFFVLLLAFSLISLVLVSSSSATVDSSSRTIDSRSKDLASNKNSNINLASNEPLKFCADVALAMAAKIYRSPSDFNSTHRSSDDSSDNSETQASAIWLIEEARKKCGAPEALAKSCFRQLHVIPSSPKGSASHEKFLGEKRAKAIYSCLMRVRT